MCRVGVRAWDSCVVGTGDRPFVARYIKIAHAFSSAAPRIRGGTAGTRSPAHRFAPKTPVTRNIIYSPLSEGRSYYYKTCIVGTCATFGIQSIPLYVHIMQVPASCRKPNGKKNRVIPFFYYYYCWLYNIYYIINIYIYNIILQRLGTAIFKTTE